MFRVPEEYRQKAGSSYLVDSRLSTTEVDGNNGIFILPLNFDSKLFCVASDGLNWEHVSVSVVGKKRCPTWEEMCLVKNLFWSEDECVIQYHPKKEDYVNIHPYCLHLWKPLENAIPTPPKFMVG